MPQDMLAPPQSHPLAMTLLPTTSSPLPHAGPAWLGQLPEDAAEMLGVFQPQEADKNQRVKLWSTQEGCSDACGGLSWP